MSRSAKDATRFTPNTPQAYSRGPAASAAGNGAKTTSSRSSMPSAFSSSIPGTPTRTETPQEKVARLRTEHLKRRTAQLSAWDKVVLRGRSMADAAHRWTIFGILTFSVLAGGLTVFSAVDMIAYNRRKKREFYKEYQKLWQQRYDDALLAQTAGTATETQLAIIQQEQEAQEFHKRREDSPWKKFKGFFSFKGLSNDETIAETWERRKELMTDGELASTGVGATTEGEIMQAVEARRQPAREQLGQGVYKGGQLDQLAANVADATSSRTSRGTSWFSFGGRSSSA